MANYGPTTVVKYAIDAALDRSYRRVVQARKMFHGRDLRMFNELYSRSKELIQERQAVIKYAQMPNPILFSAHIEYLKTQYIEYKKLMRDYVATPEGERLAKFKMTPAQFDVYVEKQLQRLGFTDPKAGDKILQFGGKIFNEQKK